MGTVNQKSKIRNLILVITGIFLATLFLGSLAQTVLAQSPTCYDPATGAVCTDTPGPTCGLPGLPACPTQPPSNPPPATDTPVPVYLPRPTNTPSPTSTPTTTPTITGVVPCVNPAYGGNVNPNRPMCTPQPCFSIGSDRQCTPTPVIGGGTGTNAPAPLPPYLLIGGAGGIIIVCVLGIGLWMRFRRNNGGMGDGSVNPTKPNSPTDPFAKIEISPGPSQDGANEFRKAFDPFDKLEVNPGPQQDGASQFQKADDLGSNASQQFIKGESAPGENLGK